MPRVPCIEVSVSFSVAECARLTPVAWAMLRALQTFPTGSRPAFTTLSQKLHIFEVSFLDSAWAVLCEHRAVTHHTFDMAEPTSVGLNALKTNYFLLSPQDDRVASIYLGRDGNRSVESSEFDLEDDSRKFTIPAWAGSHQQERLIDALKHQSPDKLPSAGEKILDWKFDWENARFAYAFWGKQT